jgi:uroporphyrinogen-III decarboxylase
MNGRAKGGFSSRERMLAAINHQEPDHVPLFLQFVETKSVPSRGKIEQLFPPEFRGTDMRMGTSLSEQFGRAEKLLTLLGIDDILKIGAPHAVDLSQVTVRLQKGTVPGERVPLLTKEYETPKGILRQVVRQTADWPHGDDVPLRSDHLVPRSKEFAVKGPEDVDKLRYMLRPPSAESIGQFRDDSQRLKQFAGRWQVLVEGHVGSVGTTGCHLMGITNLVLRVMDDADFGLELFELLHRWEMAGLEVMLDMDVADVIVVNGFYESLQMWSPTLYRKFFFQPLQEKIRVIHQSGAKCAYNMSSKLLPLIPMFKELELDVVRYLDPLKGETDLEGLEREAGDSLCFLGGVNGAVTVGQGSVEDVRREVVRAIRTLAPGGGLILSAADAIYEDAPWENVVALIDAWREVGRYPIRIA